MEDLFGDVDLNELANSEKAIIENTEVGNIPTEPPTGEVETEGEAVLEDTGDGIDITTLETSETEIIKNTGSNSIEEETDKNTSQTPADSGNGDSPSSIITNTLTSFKEALNEAGVFSFLEEEDIEKITDAESLVEAIQKQTEVGKYAHLNDNQKKYLEALESGVPHQEYAEHTSNAEQYRVLTEEQVKNSPELQTELIRRKFLIKGESAENAAKYAQILVADGKGEEEATLAKEELINYEQGLIDKKVEEAKSKQEAEKLQAQKKLEELKSTINEKSEIIPGIKINSITKDKIYDSLTSIADMKDTGPQNEVMKNYEENEEYKLKLHALHVITKGFTDFSKFTSTSKTNAISQLSDKLNTPSSEIKGSPTQTIALGATTRSIDEALRNLNLKQ